MSYLDSLRRFFLRNGKLEEKYLGDMDAVSDWAAFYRRYRNHLNFINDVNSRIPKKDARTILQVFEMADERMKYEENKSKLPKMRQEYLDERLGML